MGVWGRLTAFLIVLLGTFGTAYSLGEKLPGHSHADGHSHGPESVVPPGFEFGNYQLVTDSVTGGDGSPRTLTFHLQMKDSMRVTDFQMVHEALLHTVLVRPDLSGFRHLHPDIAADGSWQVTLDEPGQWHLVFDSTPVGESAPVVVSANADDEVQIEAVPLPDADDDVTLKGLRIIRDGVNFNIINADGTAADGLEPYLGQPAHLIAIRQGDLAYIHLHPTMEMVGMFMFGPATDSSLPAPGTYRMFLQFGYRGEVLTVPYTVVQS